MSNTSIPKWLNLILVLFLSFLGISLFLAIFGLFKRPVILALLILGAAIFITYLVLKRFLHSSRFAGLGRNDKGVSVISTGATEGSGMEKSGKRRTLSLQSKYQIIIIVLILFISILTGLFHHHIPLGRDEMAYITSAAKIRDTGSLKFEDILSRPFHPFREIKNNIFTSQFLPGYSVYLSTFYTLGSFASPVGGLKTLWWANPVLLFLTLLVLYYIGKNLVSKKAGVITVLLYSSFYTTIWFTRRTNCENLFAFLIWAGILFFILGYKNKDLRNLFLGLFSFSLSCFVRGEGLAYFAIYLIILIILLAKKQLTGNSPMSNVECPMSSNNNRTIFLYSLPILSSIFLLVSYFKIYGTTYLITQGQVYLTAIFRHKQFIFYGLGLILILFIIYKLLKKNKRINIRGIIFIAIFLTLIASSIYYLNWLNVQEKVSWSSIKYYYFYGSLFKYGLLLYVLIICFGLFKNLFSKLEYLVILLLSPCFLFLLEPGVALDHPWMIRRFQAVFIPLLFLLTALVISKCKRFLHSPDLGVGVGRNDKGVSVISTGATEGSGMEKSDKRQASARLAFAGLVCLLLFNLSFSYPLLIFSEYKNIQPQLEKFTQQFTKKDLILCEPGWHWQQWSYAWHYIYGLNILPKVTDRNGNPVYTKEELESIAKKYDRVFLLTARGDYKHPYFKEAQYKHIFSFELTWPELDKTGIPPRTKEMTKSYVSSILGKLPPSNIKERKIGLGVYQIDIGH